MTTIDRRRLLTTAVPAVALSALLAGAGYAAGRAGADEGHDMAGAPITERAAAVMPFDLDATEHTFAKRARGGVETVVAVSPGDLANIDLIRGHLRREAARFAVGDFSDSAAIHGNDMPGLRALSTAGGRLRVTFEEVPAGARLTYDAGSDATLARAVHDWFDAQSTDHAMPGMG
jgi:hypothetical protein